MPWRHISEGNSMRQVIRSGRHNSGEGLPTGEETERAIEKEEEQGCWIKPK